MFKKLVGGEIMEKTGVEPERRRRRSLACEIKGILSRAVEQEVSKRRGSVNPLNSATSSGSASNNADKNGRRKSSCQVLPSEMTSTPDVGGRRSSLLLTPEEQVSQLRGILLKETRRRSSVTVISPPLEPQSPPGNPGEGNNRGRSGSLMPISEFARERAGSVSRVLEEDTRRRNSLFVSTSDLSKGRAKSMTNVDEEEKMSEEELQARPRSRRPSPSFAVEHAIVQQYQVTLTDELRAALQAQESGEFHPELIVGRSEILDFDDVILLGKNINDNCPWFLTFSTLINGNSLETLYQQAGHIKGATLIIIKTTEKQVFGALLSDPPKYSEDYYGTGQSFLFQCRPSWAIYRYTGKDQHIIHGSHDSLSVGAMDESGNCALQINSKLTEGKTSECVTYGNKPLAPNYNFKIKVLECWHFGLPANADA